MTNNTQVDKTRHANPHFYSDEYLINQTGLTSDELKNQFKKLETTMM